MTGTGYAHAELEGMFLFWNPLAVACWKGAPKDVIELLLDLSPDSIMYEDEGGRSIFQFACHGQPWEVIQFLMHKSGGRLVGKVNELDDYGKLPLHFACMNKSFELIQWLLQEGGESTAREPDSAGRVPLSYAIETGAPAEAINLLIPAGGRDALHTKGRAL